MCHFFVFHFINIQIILLLIKYITVLVFFCDEFNIDYLYASGNFILIDKDDICNAYCMGCPYRQSFLSSAQYADSHEVAANYCSEHLVAAVLQLLFPCQFRKKQRFMIQLAVLLKVLTVTS